MSHRFGGHSQQGPKSAVQRCQHCCCCSLFSSAWPPRTSPGRACVNALWTSKPQDTYVSRTARALLQLCTRLTILSRVMAPSTIDLRAAHMAPPCVAVSAPARLQAGLAELHHQALTRAAAAGAGPGWRVLPGGGRQHLHAVPDAPGQPPPLPEAAEAPAGSCATVHLAQLPCSLAPQSCLLPSAWRQQGDAGDGC